MASHALTKVSYRERLAGMRRRAHVHQETLQAPVVSTLAGAGLALLAKKGFLPVAAFGIPMKPLVIMGGAVIALNTRGMIQRGAIEAAKAAGAVYGYEAIMTGSWVAGDDDDEM